MPKFLKIIGPLHGFSGGQYFVIMSNGVICVPLSVSLSTASLLSAYERTVDSMVSLHTESVICRLISLFIVTGE